MAYSYALLSDQEALRALKQENASDPLADQINDALYAASQEIQDYLERKIVKLSTKHWVEYHERSRTEPTILRVMHWPIQTDWASLEVNEDNTRAFGASTVLTSGTDYRIKDEGDHTSKIERLSGGTPISWYSGYEVIRVTLKGGWALADIPPSIKRVCRVFMGRLYNDTVNQQYAFERIDDARGSVTHFGPAMLMRHMLGTLAEYKDHGATTCVRFTEEDDSP